jgi:hypothetical protein
MVVHETLRSCVTELVLTAAGQVPGTVLTFSPGSSLEDSCGDRAFGRWRGVETARAGPPKVVMSITAFRRERA